MSSADHDQLVEFLGRQFTGIDRRFDGVDRQLTDLRHESLGHFDDIYGRFERLEQEYQAITQALRRIEVGLGEDPARRESLLRDLAELRQHVLVLQSRIEGIEQRLAQ
jgi:chromosome segregation ATPase